MKEADQKPRPTQINRRQFLQDMTIAGASVGGVSGLMHGGHQKQESSNTPSNEPEQEDAKSWASRKLSNVMVGSVVGAVLMNTVARLGLRSINADKKDQWPSR